MPFLLFFFFKQDFYLSQLADCHLAVSVRVDVCVPMCRLPFFFLFVTGSSTVGYQTGKYTFDTFTHLKASIDSPSW